MALASSDTAALHAWSPWGWPVYLPPGHSRSKSNSTLLLPSGPMLMEAGRCSQVGWLRPGSPCPYSERTRWVLGLLSWHKKKITRWAVLLYVWLLGLVFWTVCIQSQQTRCITLRTSTVFSPNFWGSSSVVCCLLGPHFYQTLCIKFVPACSGYVSRTICC